MQALIFNSGLGSRLKELTADRPKAMVELASGETIFHRQLRILSSVGIHRFVVTTGPFPYMLIETAREFESSGCSFVFVQNPDYDRTNYIYSMWLARKELRGKETLMLHGDLVFDAGYVEELLTLPAGSYGSANNELPLPEKDFKARVIDGFIREVGVNVWGEGCVAFQAMYRLTADAMNTWLDEVEAFVSRDETGVYAENAANLVFHRMNIVAHSYAGHVLEEIDTSEDLARVSALIRAKDFADQPVFELMEGDSRLIEGNSAGRVRRTPRFGYLVTDCGLARPLVVADAFLTHSELETILGPGKWPVFSGYKSNPTYEQVVSAVNTFRDSGCDSVVSVGGGSAIDVAKCVGLWAGMPGGGSGKEDDPRFCDRASSFSSVRHVALPTTAGTGSESTHFAVIYVNGEKRSVATDCAQPDVALLVPRLLSGLPDYQRKSTMLDALCQAIESHWSVASSVESRDYSSRAIPMIMGCWEAYISGDAKAASTMHHAANLAGRAINLTTTTLAHAMSYKLTSLFGIAHGHAVALCMSFAWKTLLRRGNDTTSVRLCEIDELMAGAKASYGAGLERFERLCASLALPSLKKATAGDIDLLASSVNSQRMRNYQVTLSKEELQEAYKWYVFGGINN